MMKFIIKDNKGVSLIALIITLIVMILLAAIVLNNFFQRNIDNTNKAKLMEEFTQVENAVTLRGKENRIDGNLYNKLATRFLSSDTAESSMTVNNVTYGDGYAYIESTTGRNGDDIFSALGVNGVNHDYIVNYDTGFVTLVEPIYIDGRPIYTKDDLIGLETDNTVIGEAEWDEKKGVNKPVILSGMLPVKREGGKWVITNGEDEEWYDYTMSSSGGPVRYANVMLMDEITVSKDGRTYDNEQVRGMTLATLKGMTVEKEGSMFLWVPRYTFKDNGNGDIEIRYSKLTSDYTREGFVKNPAFYRGDYIGATDENENAGYIAGGKELTGYWISKYEAGYVN